MSSSSSPRPIRRKNSFKDYFAIGEVFGYFFRKPDPNRKTNFNLRMMHGINKVSIGMFLAAMLFVIARIIWRSL